MIKSSSIRTVGIVGGGLSRLSAAYYLRDKPLKIEVIEFSSHVEGLAQRINLWDKQNAYSTPNILLLAYWTDLEGLSTPPNHRLIGNVQQNLKKLNLTFVYEDCYIKSISKAYRIPELGTVNKIRAEKRTSMMALFLQLAGPTAYILLWNGQRYHGNL